MYVIFLISSYQNDLFIGLHFFAANRLRLKIKFEIGLISGLGVNRKSITTSSTVMYLNK